MSNNIKDIFEKLGLLDQGESTATDDFSFKRKKMEDDLLSVDDDEQVNFNESFLEKKPKEKTDLFATGKKKQTKDDFDSLFSDDSDEMDLFLDDKDDRDKNNIFVDDTNVVDEVEDEKDMFLDLDEESTKTERAAEENFIFAEEDLADSEVSDQEVDDLLSGLDNPKDSRLESDNEEQSNFAFEELFNAKTTDIAQEQVVEEQTEEQVDEELILDSDILSDVSLKDDAIIETEDRDLEDRDLNEATEEIDTAAYEASASEQEISPLRSEVEKTISTLDDQVQMEIESTDEQLLDETISGVEAELDLDNEKILAENKEEAVAEIDLSDSLFPSKTEISASDSNKGEVMADNAVIDFIQMPTEEEVKEEVEEAQFTEVQKEEKELNPANRVTTDIEEHEIDDETIDLIDIIESEDEDPLLSLIEKSNKQIEEKSDTFYQIEDNKKYDNFEAVSNFTTASSELKEEQIETEVKAVEQSSIDKKPQQDNDQLLEVEKMDNNKEKSKFILNESNVLLDFLEENEGFKPDDKTIDYINTYTKPDLNFNTEEDSLDFTDYPDFSTEKSRENSYVNVERKIDRIIESFDRNKLFSVEDIYKKALLNKDIKSSIFMVEVYSKALPDNLPLDVKRESVINIMKAADLEVDGMLEDAYLRIDALNRVQENVVKVTTELKEKNEKSIADLEKRIKELKRNTHERELFQNKQNTIIEYEMQRIINILDFIKHK